MKDETAMPPAETYPRFANVAGLHPNLKSALEKMELVTMTEIQAKTFEAASANQDVLGRARTGTGKTVAFLLPALQQLLEHPQQMMEANQVSILILSPTRELAAQISEQARLLLQTSSSSKPIITQQVIVGGTNKPKDVSAFERRIPTILVATPGRLCDHLQTTTVRGQPFSKAVSKTKILVLDETDRLLDMGFRREIEKIISYLGPPQQRQTLLFSATIPPEVRNVMAKTMKKSFVSVDCIHDHDASSHTNAQVQQSHVIVPAFSRLVTGTIEILTSIIDREKGDLKMVVFFPTANLVAFYAKLFNESLRVPVQELHSRKSQSFRTKTADNFREAENAVLFTSDVSARGVDYPGVTHVVQFGIADSRESYIHRLGRTGRAGKVGEGVLVLTDLEQMFMQSLEGLDIPVNQEMQNMVDGSPSPQMMSKVDPILSSIRSGRDDGMTQSVRSAYQSMLGFYNGKLAKLGVRGNDALVDFVNSFAFQAGLSEIPELELRTVKKMGLAGAKGLNVVKSLTVNRGGGGGGGGGRGAGGSGRGSGGGGNGRGSGGQRGGSGAQMQARGGGGNGGRGRPEGTARDGSAPQKRRSTTAGRGASSDTKKARPEGANGRGSAGNRNRRPNND
ncbi:hypothetical protein MPSEU_000445700 [Mayamaea pseudoterrestris]|nr:hypothetical protein MPSEU_000445700 [Mayamaea pseudoterrestris]